MQIEKSATAVAERLIYNNSTRHIASGYFNLVFGNGNGTISTRVKTTGDAVALQINTDNGGFLATWAVNC